MKNMICLAMVVSLLGACNPLAPNTRRSDISEQHRPGHDWSQENSGNVRVSSMDIFEDLEAIETLSADFPFEGDCVWADEDGEVCLDADAENTYDWGN